VWSVPRGYERLREWELTSLEIRNSKGTAIWPEEELEDFVSDVTCGNLESVRLIVVTTSEDLINRFTNPIPRLSH
jgi:hypothetical protein